MPLRDLLLGLFVIAIWALNIIVIKVGVAELPPLLMTTLRFMLVATLLVPFYPVARVQLPFLLLLSVTFGSLHFALLFIGLEHAEAGTGALLVQMGTPFATLLAVIFLKEKLGPKRIAGLLLSLCWGRRAGGRANAALSSATGDPVVQCHGLGGVAAVDQARPTDCADGTGGLGGAVRSASGRVGVMAL